MDIGVGLLGLAAALSIAIATIAPALAQGNAAARAMEVSPASQKLPVKSVLL